MARSNYGIEKGIDLYAENGDIAVSNLFGAGAPGSNAQENNANVGSSYQESGSGDLYIKDTAGSGTDKWKRLADQDDIDNIQCESTSAAITTEVVLDSFLVDIFKAAVWEVVLSLDSDPARVIMFTIGGIHDGIIAPGTPADAVNTDDSIGQKHKIGANFDHVVSTGVSGVGAAQVMQLKISASAAITAAATCRRVRA